MWRRTVSPEDAPDAGADIKITFVGGDAVAVDDKTMSPAELLSALNATAGAHAIGRADIVESRYVGMKSRGCYETPGGELLLRARKILETLTLDREVLRLRQDLAPRYAALVYNGYWFSPERELLQGLFDRSQARVSGEVFFAAVQGQHHSSRRSLGQFLV